MSFVRGIGLGTQLARAYSDVLSLLTNVCIPCRWDHATAMNGEASCQWHGGKFQFPTKRLVHGLSMLIDRRNHGSDPRRFCFLGQGHTENCEEDENDKCGYAEEIGKPEMRKDYTEGFFWLCCGAVGHEPGQKVSPHRPGGIEKYGGWLRYRKDCR